MNFDIVMITSGSRPRLLEQSLRSLRENASYWNDHALTLVMDGCSVVEACRRAATIPNRAIINPERQGASRSRNIGASSTPKYLRKDAVMFVDDDIYACPGWDDKLGGILLGANRIASGHAHPYNHTINREFATWQETTVLSTVHMAMSWSVWDGVGFWTEPGGAGGSEDVDYCLRATKLGVGLLLTKPQSILHTGIGSTSGKKLVGWESVMENNRKLEHIHGIVGKVLYE